MITKDKLLDILNDWNFWKKDLETGIERKLYLEEMERYFKMGLIVSLVGLRRSGKSTLMQQFMKKLVAEKKAEKKDILYVNFEDSRFVGEYSLDLLNNIYDVYLENLKPQKTPIIFLDEIQNIDGWEKFVNSLSERKKAKIFVSGSSAHLLSSEFSSVLTGRQLSLIVYPLTFEEFLLFNNVEVGDKLDFANQKNKIRKLFSDYARYGGMPKPSLLKLKNDKETLLRNYLEDILTRDLIERFKIRQTEKLKVLTKFYLTHISSLMSYNKVEKFLKIPLTTVERFSGYLTYPFLIYFVNKFAFSLKEQTVSPRKVYAADLGMRNAATFGGDEGRVLENLAFLRLIKDQKEVFYYKTKNNLEVDFLARKGREKQLIQATLTLKNFATRDREINALKTAMKELNLKSGLILTKDEEDEFRFDGKTITVQPLYRWLLGK